jgi:hypothetical protein
VDESISSSQATIGIHHDFFVVARHAAKKFLKHVATGCGACGIRVGTSKLLWSPISPWVVKFNDLVTRQATAPEADGLLLGRIWYGQNLVVAVAETGIQYAEFCVFTKTLLRESS